MPLEVSPRHLLPTLVTLSHLRSSTRSDSTPYYTLLVHLVHRAESMTNQLHFETRLQPDRSHLPRELLALHLLPHELSLAILRRLINYEKTTLCTSRYLETLYVALYAVQLQPCVMALRT